MQRRRNVRIRKNAAAVRFETFLRGAAREKRAVPEKNTKRHRSGQGDGWHGTSLSLPE